MMGGKARGHLSGAVPGSGLYCRDLGAGGEGLDAMGEGQGLSKMWGLLRWAGNAQHG